MSDVIWKRALKTALTVLYFIVCASIGAAIYGATKYALGPWFAIGFGGGGLILAAWALNKEPTHD